MTYSLILLTALGGPGADPATSSAPPTQAVANIDGKGNLTMVIVSDACYQASGVNEVTVKKGKDTVKVKVKVTSLMVTTATIPAKHVNAYTVDGKAIDAKKLATLLAKERTVLVALDGKKVDPFLLELYKEGTILLVPPANALSPGGYVGAYGIAPEPRKMPDDPRPKEKSDDPKPKDK